VEGVAMNVPWSPVVFLDISGSVLVLIISCYCVILARQLANNKPDDIFRNYLFLFTLAIVCFAVSRSFGHLVKQLLLMNDMSSIWKQISPFSGAVNSTTFVVIFAFGISFHRFQKVHAEVEYYKENLEEMIADRTEELEKSKNILENILNNTNPINITGVNFDLLRANAAYYAVWPKVKGEAEIVKCFESRPGAHCNTDNCPLKQIVEGSEEVRNEVSKNIDGNIRNFIVTAKPFRDIDGKLIGMVESFQDITFRKQAETAVRDSEERFRQIFESSPDPVILAKLLDGAIIDVNKAFEAATGIKRIEAIGHNSEDLGFWADESRRGLFREQLELKGEVDNFEADFRVRDGQVRTGLLSARILTVGEESCLLIVIRDITTEKAAELALIEMDRMKSEFISTAAHELNTPLCTMMGYTEFLRDPEQFGGFSKEQKQDFIDEIYDRGEALSRIIEDLLDISRIESGNPAPLDLQETDLLDLLRKKVKLFLIGDSRHTFRLDLPDKSVKSLLMIDRHRINQALDNLLSNAVKYSPKGKEILLKVREEKDGWEVRIKDEGIGMTPEQVDRIFDKFYRADASDTAISGLGLGMNITRQIIKSHGGAIRVESVEGNGTTVIFTLPYREV
jgi:PAS domain S-box-containing protein